MKSKRILTFALALLLALLPFASAGADGTVIKTRFCTIGDPQHGLFTTDRCPTCYDEYVVSADGSEFDPQLFQQYWRPASNAELVVQANLLASNLPDSTSTTGATNAPIGAPGEVIGVERQKWVPGEVQPKSAPNTQEVTKQKGVLKPSGKRLPTRLQDLLANDCSCGSTTEHHEPDCPKYNPNL